MNRSLVRSVVGGLATPLLASSMVGCKAGGGIDWEKVREGLKSDLSKDIIIAGLKQALEVGSERAAKKLSRRGGYANDKGLRIPLPSQLRKLGDTLRKVGLGKQVDQFEYRMNRAAEEAARESVPIFVDAIFDMTFDDARKILNGNDTAATAYFRRTTEAKLRKLYRPIVRREVDRVGLVKAYHALVDTYHKVSFAPRIKFSIETYVADRALDGLFKTLGAMEKDIRRNIKARTTELLRKVFGAK